MSLTSMSKPGKEAGPEKIARQRAELMEASVSYVRTGKDGSMRERLRMASEMSGISELAIEAACGDIERIKANVERKP